MAEDQRATFKVATIDKILRMHFTDGKTKLNNDAAKLTVEFLRVFAHEGAARAAEQSGSEGSTVVDLHHMEKILPQLLLDF
ncbi:centromere protein X-like isoform X2 [Anneissia japonica]|uniref:centromere protein X-like isoform X2 n=1 Tax=Anneissia japonica TaxID=1529436 RepID=UPI0014257B8A|nr:centromere protein X-like isoform X2 [Anneissia japonica]